jgi:hypothetical protein
MTSKLHMDQARSDGFIIDTCCNPPVAYKGPRFQPTQMALCYTELESALLALVPVVRQLSEDDSAALAPMARAALAQLPADALLYGLL